MKPRVFVTIILTLLLLNINAQNYLKYYRKVNKAEELYYNNQFEKAIKMYQKAFKTEKVLYDDYFKLAKCYAALNDKENTFKYIYKAYESGCFMSPEYLEQYIHDNNLFKYKNTTEWKELKQKYPELSNKSYALLNDEAFKELSYLHDSVDQKLRKSSPLGSGTIINFTKKEDSIKKLVEKTDLENSVKFRQIIKKYGCWPGKYFIGSNVYAVGLFKHFPDSVQKKLFPFIFKELKKGHISPEDVCVFVDEYNLHHGLKQKYGGVTMYDKNGKLTYLPIEDEKNVDKRRRKIGLKKIELEARIEGIEYNPVR